MRHHLRRPAAALALAMLTVLAGPAVAASADEGHVHAPPVDDPAAPGPILPAQPVVPAPDATPAEPAEPTITVEELQRQADELEQQVRRQEDELRIEKTRLAASQNAAAAALEAYQVAQRDADAAMRVAAEEADRLAAAERETAAARARLQAYVGSLYRQGMGTQKMSVYTSLLGARGPEAFISGLGLAERVGSNQGGEMVQLAEAEAAQAQAAERARLAQQAAIDATKAAESAKRVADQYVNEAQRSVLGSTEVLLRTQGAAAAVGEREAERLALMARAEQIARQRMALPYLDLTGITLPRPSAECTGQDIGGYPNGMLPAAALCPLWGTNGHMLRADAAAAFNEMSREYSSVFGAPICVTDSYRTFDEQVAVKIAKPDLAATPGRSNHGWALAVDLCDGVQSFGTVTHNWLRYNSLRYGWFLPAWAMPGGSKPEPWHWEYAG